MFLARPAEPSRLLNSDLPSSLAVFVCERTPGRDMRAWNSRSVRVPALRRSTPNSSSAAQIPKHPGELHVALNTESISIG